MISAGTNKAFVTALRASVAALRMAHCCTTIAAILLCGMFCASVRAQCTPVWSALGSGLNGRVHAMTVLPGGDVIVGGIFTSAGGVPANNIARYNPSTNVWSALGSGLSGNIYPVNALAVLPGGDVIVGGEFSTAGGVGGRNNIARFTPSTGLWSAMGTGTSAGDGMVRALAVLPGGDVIAGGDFSTAGGVTASRIARYSFGSAALRITAQPTSQTTCAGTAVTFSVSAAGASPITYQWLKGAVPLDADANPTAATPTLTLTNVQAADAASYSCTLTNICGSVTSNAALLTLVSCGGCSLADIAGGGPDGRSSNGIIDGTDYIAFVNSFAIGDATVDPMADIAGGGDIGLEPDGTIDGTDFIFFINAFAIGC
jgi:hypothetical protein